jgi:hypothetical protein
MNRYGNPVRNQIWALGQGCYQASNPIKQRVYDLIWDRGMAPIHDRVWNLVWSPVWDRVRRLL